MSDDIVTRLGTAATYLVAHTEHKATADLLDAAINEIERLRADRDRWRRACEASAEAGDIDSIRHAGELYHLALDGDTRY